MVKTNKVRARIVEMGLSYNSIAKEIDIDKSTLSLKINNKRPIYLTEVVSLCKILKIDTAEELKDYFSLDFLILPKSHENVTEVT